MILEAIVTTADDEGAVNVAPMGPTVPDVDPYRWTSFVLRPFKSSRTYANLKYNPQGVLHVTDDVLLFAQATLGSADIPTVEAETVAGRRLADCCRYHEFVIESWDDGQDRATLSARILHSGYVRDFFGFNRAMAAVIEAAILASRTHLLPADFLRSEFARLRTIVDKTAGEREQQAFRILSEHVEAKNGGR